jgi:hypothetical protein
MNVFLFGKWWLKGCYGYGYIGDITDERIRGIKFNIKM